jgi:antitoxin (DNA-binding transcriptional repressor) of toxin-antitoxin stability system
MTNNVTIDEAQSKLREIIAALGPNDEVVITENQQPVAKITWRSPISIAIGGWLFLEENFSGSPKAEACAGAVVE